MDLVLEKADDLWLDSLWARFMPLRLPVDELFLNNTLAKPAAALVKSAAATAYSNSLLYSGPQQDSVTVAAWPRDDWRRQFISLCALTFIGTHLMYFVVAGFSYTFLYDHRMMKHPRFLKNQVKQEIKSSLAAFGPLTLLTVPWFVLEAQGYTQCYGSMADGPFGDTKLGWAYLVFSLGFFLWFTDFCIYFVHRWEHHPAVYKHLHKPHHRWVIPTPFASHAFHPLDGYAQSLPYHIFIVLFPLHKLAYLGLFAFVNLWTVAIHDSDMVTDHPLERIVNGPAHHTLHHLYFTCNYGQFFTFCDRGFGSYRHPAKTDDPLHEAIAAAKKPGKSIGAPSSIATPTKTATRRRQAELSDASDDD